MFSSPVGLRSCSSAPLAPSGGSRVVARQSSGGDASDGLAVSNVPQRHVPRTTSRRARASGKNACFLRNFAVFATLGSGCTIPYGRYRSRADDEFAVRRIAGTIAFATTSADFTSCCSGVRVRHKSAQLHHLRTVDGFHTASICLQRNSFCDSTPLRQGGIFQCHDRHLFFYLSCPPSS